MLRIRLTRTGKRHQPHYRIVVAEHTAPIQGKFIDSLGHYNPRSKELVVKAEDTTMWLNKGAQPSNTVAKLLLKSGLTHKLLVVHTFPERPAKREQAQADANAGAPAKEAGSSTEEAAAEAAEASPMPVEEPKEESAEEAKPAEEAPTA